MREPRQLPPASDQLRRLDWRFLLPTPELRRVGFLGPPASTLLRALLDCGCDVLSIPAQPPTDSSVGILGAPDVCVVQSARVSELELAARLLAPGGWLYWELRRASRLLAPWHRLRAGHRQERLRFTALSGQRQLLERLGLNGVTSSWHYPDFDSCRWIVPLDGGAGARYFVRTSRASRRPVFERLGAAVIASGLVPGLGSSVSFVARKPVPAGAAAP